MTTSCDSAHDMSHVEDMNPGNYMILAFKKLLFSFNRIVEFDLKYQVCEMWWTKLSTIVRRRGGVPTDYCYLILSIISFYSEVFTST